MENVALVMTALNSVAGILAWVLIRVMKGRADAKSAIRKAVKKVYIEFGNNAAAGVPDSELEIGGIPDYNFQGVEKCAKQIERLHWSSVLDITKLARVESILKYITPVVFIMMVFAIISALFGGYHIDQKSTIQELLVIWIPLVSFVFEVLFLIWILNAGSYLSSVINTYDNSEY